MLTGAQLWRAVEPYARTVAYHFYWKCEADWDDCMQDVAVMCLEFPTKYPDKPEKELELMARRAVWNKALDCARRKKVHQQIMFDSSLRRRGVTTRAAEPAVEAAEIVDRLKTEIIERDLPVFELRVKGYESYAEMASMTGLSERAVHNSIARIHTAARRYQ